MGIQCTEVWFGCGVAVLWRTEFDCPCVLFSCSANNIRHRSFLLTLDLTIMYTISLDGINTAFSSYNSAISQHVLKKNVILCRSINKVFGSRQGECKAKAASFWVITKMKKFAQNGSRISTINFVVVDQNHTRST